MSTNEKTVPPLCSQDTHLYVGTYLVDSPVSPVTGRTSTQQSSSLQSSIHITHLNEWLFNWTEQLISALEGSNIPPPTSFSIIAWLISLMPLSRPNLGFPAYKWCLQKFLFSDLKHYNKQTFCLCTVEQYNSYNSRLVIKTSRTSSCQVNGKSCVLWHFSLTMPFFFKTTNLVSPTLISKYTASSPLYCNFTLAWKHSSWIMKTVFSYRSKT